MGRSEVRARIVVGGPLLGSVAFGVRALRERRQTKLLGDGPAHELVEELESAAARKDGRRRLPTASLQITPDVAPYSSRTRPLVKALPHHNTSRQLPRLPPESDPVPTDRVIGRGGARGRRRRARHLRHRISWTTRAAASSRGPVARRLSPAPPARAAGRAGPKVTTKRNLDDEHEATKKARL